jgi:nitrogen regulatory protein PII-like uncharacterized protein
MARKRRPPLKLEWLDHCWKWTVNESRHEGISQQAALNVITLLMKSADSDGTGARVSARHLEREAGVNKTRAKAFLDELQEAGWLYDTGRRSNNQRIYQLAFHLIRIADDATARRGDAPSPPYPRMLGTLRPHPESQGGDKGGDAGGDAASTTSDSDKEEEEKGRAAPLNATPPAKGKDDEERDLKVELWDRWRVIAKKLDIEPSDLDVENSDLLAEYRRLSRWNAGQLLRAIAKPKEIKTSTTGWFLSRLRGLPGDPFENLKVAEEQIHWLIESIADSSDDFAAATTRAEKASSIEWPLDE